MLMRENKNNKQISFNIPDITTDGMLKKVWMSVNGVSTLIKAGAVAESDRKNLLSANEIAVTEIANLLGINHVQYYPVKISNKYEDMMCACSCFINTPDSDAITMLQIIHENYKYSKTGIVNFYKEIGAENEYYQMLFLNALVGNFDRHEKNIMFNKDFHTGEYSLLPIFDSGSSLAYFSEYDDMIKPLYLNRQEQIRYTYRHVQDCVKRIDEDVVKDIIRQTYEMFGIDEKLYKKAVNVVDYGIKAVKTCE